MDVRLCKLSRDAFDDFKSALLEAEGERSAGVAFHVVDENKHEIHFAVIADHPLDASALPLARLPENTSLAKTASELEESRSRIAQMEIQLAKLAVHKPALKKRADELKERLEFLERRDSMGENEIVAHITGYIPEPDIEKLKDAAEKHGWGLFFTEPKPEDDTPTYIKVPKFLEMSKPIFDFISISPGYNEWDVSTCFLFFFTIFVSIIVGDAGYGAVFLVLSILAKFAVKQTENTRKTVNLLILLSVSTIVWGALNGTWFAIKPEALPKWMRGIEWFTDPEMKSKHVQQLCFLIAAVHLSLAHIWRTILYINSRKALGEIGWACLIWGNYITAVNLIVYPGGEWPITLLASLYGAGAVLTFLFAVDWRDIGDICNYPFGLIGSFVDLLSYIRLFAVGLASFYIADSFNSMGLSMTGGGADSPVVSALMFAVAVLVILAGHLLNVVLAGLAILVHGVRLNTLEFSNHMSLQWLGRVYEPFKKHNE
jgi:V/A-type H+-transporting ATPase subunit I